MKVLLVNPDYDIERYMGRHLGRMGWVMPPMGLLYLAGQLEREGLGVRVYDAQVEPRALVDVLAEYEPDMVGITCASALVESSFAAAALVKKHSAEITVLVGGIHPTVRPEEILGCPEVDIVVRGEGLLTIGEIARSGTADCELAAIDGISFRSEERIIHNPARELERDVDSLPFPARHLVPMKRYRMSPDLSLRRPFDIVFTAFGCPYDCVFCGAQVVMGGSYRLRSNGNVMEEIDSIIREYGLRSLLVGDDNFVISKERALEFCELYSARGHHRRVPWQVSTRVDSVDGEILRAMKRAGCYMVSFGIESGVARLLESVGKETTPEQTEAAVRLAKEAGLRVRGTFILGLPNETLQESLETIRFSRRLPLDQVRFGLLTPFPGTRLWDAAEREGGLHVPDWLSLSLMGGYRDQPLPYVAPGRNSEELKRLQRRANLGFYFRPRIILGFLSRIRSPSELVEYARGAWGLVRATVSPN